ncbi:hypothetical protein A2856_01990 [Candidatus Uhrbacteria bacterium RIFCSPHIGHO2_01_FULL_63_20]|uniref:YgjP-like metallopeptidase domain-containing protein n=1 Tax=Candidatus Uhrbacteria bacterium RIFCSPHIGHO2_01_FULL_63_20 TaxID=1802385 RepID=A0A1F7TKD3_9BACT|nr:MAG: hypothetical protein A2856_01990 [Candidatus Uhrbacteria bacterium RIFCSPHIGHO2_01_FULL_63_20]
MDSNPYAPQGLARFRHRAKHLVLSRLAHYNALYGFRWERVSIRDQRTRWGSCSSTGTLSFNWRIAVIPAELADYVIVHELCHLKHLDHSSDFWAMVERAIPHHRACRRALRQIDRLIASRV